MIAAHDLASGKGHRDENFPVASALIAPRHRPVILAFYRFVRTADDVADHASAAPEEKLRLLEILRASLMGESDAAPEGVALAHALGVRGLSPRHALDLLEAFRRDVTKLRYRDWDDLMDYCRYSAMPVGRFVLDVHGESETLWLANDALCAALQVINHLQDCGKDYRELDRVYLPLDSLVAHGARIEELAAPAASPGLQATIADLARSTGRLLARSRGFAGEIRDRRLALEVGVIQSLAEDLAARLMIRDPLSQKVHHSGPQTAVLFLSALARFFLDAACGHKGHAMSAAPKNVQRRAARSSFYIAMRLMPKAEREAMFAIYAFCRRVDDIADDGIGARAERSTRLDEWRADIDALYAGEPAGRAAFLGPAVARFHLRKADFLTVIDGMDMDVVEDIVAPDLATLDLYCERVASAVGRLSIKVFGMEEEPGFALARHLGRALQLTNILRDIDEDAGIGRLYLPREFLGEIKSLDPKAIVAGSGIDAACRRAAHMAHEHYEAAGRILAARPKGRLRTPRLMGAVYREILRRTEAAGFASPRVRVSLGKATLLGFVLRYGFSQ